ncbi:hypothetical protein ACFRJ7_19265 [Streptomyces sp. NPDC056747]|uniref:hypothetical protein n=1 Tax=Streptomyces sp. NPDC056747 TaxID=3345935 RepID=UPI003688D3E0
MNHSENVDHDAVLRARTMLLGSEQLSVVQLVEAYRVLAKVSPAAYLPKLAGALTSYGYEVQRVGRAPGAGLALYMEAVEAARRIDAAEPNRAKVLGDTLGSYERALFGAGRRAEGRAVCEEAAAMGRTGRLANVLAEEGRHGEAAELHGRSARAGSEVSFSSTVPWAAELAAAGRHEEAVAAFTELADATRRRAEDGRGPLAHLVWDLVHRARMLDAVGRREEAGDDRREALLVLTRLSESGEPKQSGGPSWWATLFALASRAEESAASPEAPMPPFGADLVQWSHDTRDAYLAGIPALAAETARLTEAGRLLEASAAHRRLTARTAVGVEHRPFLFRDRLRPLFDEGVALARRLTAHPGTLSRALADRSMFLVRDERYEDARTDLAEAVALLDGPTSPPIVTRT